MFAFASIGDLDNDEPQTYPVMDSKSGEIVYVTKDKVKRYKSGIVDVPIEL